MATWVPDETDDLDALIRPMTDMYASAEQQLRAALAMQGRAGIKAGEAPETWLQRAEAMAALRRDTTAIHEWLTEQTPDLIASITASAAEYGANAALQQMAVLADVVDPSSTSRVATAAAQNIAADLTSKMDDVRRRVLRFPDDVYRRAVGASAPSVTLGISTGHQAQRVAWDRLMAQNVTGFVDKANRNWGLSSYTEMATRSATRRAWNDTHADQMREHGLELVSVIVGRGGCKSCSAWAGKILRIDDGPTGRIEVEHATEDRTTKVRVHGTIAQAEADGWRHPNCRCTVAAYLPGLSAPARQTTYDAEAEQQRTQQRYLERQVRAWKSREASALDDAAAKAARARIRGYQERLRTLVRESGFPRQPRREQINLGNG